MVFSPIIRDSQDSQLLCFRLKYYLIWEICIQTVFIWNPVRDNKLFSMFVDFVEWKFDASTENTHGTRLPENYIFKEIHLYISCKFYMAWILVLKTIIGLIKTTYPLTKKFKSFSVDTSAEK